MNQVINDREFNNKRAKILVRSRDGNFIFIE